MQVPFVDLTRDSSQLNAVSEAFERVVRSGRYVLGPEVEAFEREFASFCGCGYGVGVASGTDALFLALKALGISRGDRVLTAANSFVATFIAISMCGATPVPVDVEPHYYCIDPEKVERVSVASVSAVVPVHLYGQLAEIDRLGSICAERGIPLIEDACQAHGARLGSAHSGSTGIAGCFSFSPAKNLGGFGDGGMIVTDDRQLAERLRMLRNYGRSSKNLHGRLGYNSRLDAVQAAGLRVKLETLRRGNRTRCELAGLYDSRLKRVNQVTVPEKRDDRASHVYHLYVIRCKRRDRLREHLRSHGVNTGIHYPLPVHLQPGFHHLGYSRGDFPVAEELAGQILSLPMFPQLSPGEVSYVCDAIEDFYSSKG